MAIAPASLLAVGPTSIQEPTAAQLGKSAQLQPPLSPFSSQSSTGGGKRQEGRVTVTITIKGRQGLSSKGPRLAETVLQLPLTPLLQMPLRLYDADDDVGGIILIIRVDDGLLC
ncbi:hypothetical protein N7462_000530 [Penicillium macrosclerotiorum]|uniref:uncharacterized protein n=1 Tax=Penicillium macrosclerotiorum TaxID=303699 RepID=UPI0025466744|nr:uncharacterized protein N7462_000530 [Penicillium macrosclerotiorum]KAJ5698525.1 hypothetical protein N7462_000530 [Penicillium macrosclerotiorum]